MRHDEQGTKAIDKEVAEIAGLENTKQQEWDEDPKSMLHEATNLDWSLLKKLLDLSQET
ncbi:hypothetical protein FOQG_17377 [Fusarium oxysporum f. sp. raphani 54005]|uniref:Uncharacterized protein n=2 Tax=Fusarium oxysporum f. sp. raphani TaxID=96318 RepID=X0BGF2_FUSOX|nr:hypothetical protein FOQG_17377 [Fusarium oxysporum f. sp. raphani 54005]